MVSSNAKTLPRDPYPPAAVVDQGYLRWVRFFLGVWVVPTVVGWMAINFQIVNAWKQDLTPEMQVIAGALFTSLSELRVDTVDVLGMLVEGGLSEFLDSALPDRFIPEGFAQVLGVLLKRLALDSKVNQRYRHLDYRLAASLEALGTAKRRRTTTFPASSTSATPPPTSWHPRPSLKRTTFSRSSAPSTSLAARDAKDLDRWIAKLAALLEEANAPTWMAAKETDDPMKVVRGLIGGARVNTVKLRLRSRTCMARWLKATRGRSRGMQWTWWNILTSGMPRIAGRRCHVLFSLQSDGLKLVKDYLLVWWWGGASCLSRPWSSSQSKHKKVWVC